MAVGRLYNKGDTMTEDFLDKLIEEIREERERREKEAEEILEHAQENKGFLKRWLR